MELWQAHYKDEQHDLNCVIENLYQENADMQFKMCIDGATFRGADFDDWELSETESEGSIGSIAKRFSLMRYGSKEQGYHDFLQSYRLEIKIPILVFSLSAQREIPAQLDIAFYNDAQNKSGTVFQLDGKKIKGFATDCEKFILTADEQCFEAAMPSSFFEASFLSICGQITGKYYLCNCFGCLYSDYSPYGQGNIGSLCCFLENKEKYLKVYSKYEGEYTIWDAFKDGFHQCQETASCKEFKPRINCLGGYRGGIYE